MLAYAPTGFGAFGEGKTKFNLFKFSSIFTYNYLLFSIVPLIV